LFSSGLFGEVMITRSSLKWVLLMLPMVIFTGAASGGETKQRQGEAIDPRTLVWPQPPQQKRIAFVTQITGVDDVVGRPKRGWMDRAAGAKQRAPRETLKSPYGVVTDSRGQIYVADAANRVVFVFNLEQKRAEKRGDRAPARLALPTGLAIDEGDRLFVSDSFLHQITCFTPAGEVAAVFGTNELQRPGGITVDSARRRLYVADVKANKIAIFDTQTFRQIGQIGGPTTPDKAEPGKFSAPSNVAVDHTGSVFVTDTWNQRVQVFDAEGKFVRAFGRHGLTPGNFVRPKGIALDKDGHLYVADAEFNNFQVLTTDGQPLLAVGDYGLDPGQFALIAGMWIDNHNRIYVTDQWRGRVQVFQYYPEQRTAARNGMTQ
jgi:DNA-binding beta-propeller fold protein YncE